MDQETYNRVTSYCKGKLHRDLQDRHLEDLIQYVAMKIWEASQKGAHQKWEWALVDYLRINGVHSTRGKLGAKTIEKSYSIDAPGINEDSENSDYLLNKESIVRFEEEEKNKNSDDLFKGVMEEFLAPINLKRETLKWVLRSYKIKKKLV
ncbi:MAG: hypothetical protein ACPGJV_02655 [Bacteriovoracaceae bacterium]